jgi:hypothetical protein
MMRWHAAPNPLARVTFELSAGRRRWTGWVAIAVALLTGAAATHMYWSQKLEPLQRQAAALKDAQQLAQGLDQARMQLQVSQARGVELEHQIDTLNKSGRDCQDELTFFRKARADRPHPARSATGE